VRYSYLSAAWYFVQLAKSHFVTLQVITDVENNIKPIDLLKMENKNNY